MPTTYAATAVKKFLDANGLAYFAQKLNNYPTNDVIAAVINGVQDALDEKVSIDSVGSVNGVASLGSDGKIPSSQLPSGITDTTYTLTQNSLDGHIITLTPSVGTATTITIPDNNTTYSAATQSIDGLMSSEDKTKLDGIAENATANQGTITGITMNGSSKGTSGVVDLGTVITSHQDISGKLDSSLKGSANGLAELDEYGKVPASQLPSYVDDVLEFASKSNFPLTGVSGIIYVDISTNLTYRWGGSDYVEISPSLALGTTSSTAYRGDYGNAAYIHATDNNKISQAKNADLYLFSVTAEGHVGSVSKVTKNDITNLGIPGSDTTYIFDGTYDSSTNKAATVSTVTSAVDNIYEDVATAAEIAALFS